MNYKKEWRAHDLVFALVLFYYNKLYLNSPIHRDIDKRCTMFENKFRATGGDDQGIDIVVLISDQNSLTTDCADEHG